MNNSKDWKQQKQQAAREGILASARGQIRQGGAGSLSLRAVARDLGLTAAALYHYFPGRDALVTALILDSAASFFQAQQQALALSSRTGLDRLLDLAGGYRAWALAHPESFSLLFGDPIPGYLAPLEQVQPAMGRMYGPLLQVLAEALAQGQLTWPVAVPANPALAASLAAWSQAGPGIEPDLLYLAMMTASRCQALLMIELGRQLPPWFADGGDLYDREMQRILHELKRSDT